MTTVRDAWTIARDRLAETSSSASLDAQVLLTDVLGAHDRAYLFAHPERVLSNDEQTIYRQAIDRRAAGEPVAYIRGFREWYDRQIIVTPDVLIPRPETELLLEAALDATKLGMIVADVCTGSGAIAVTLAANAPGVAVHATDISMAALEVARKNADASDVKIAFHHGDMLAPIIKAGVKVDILISNPPYIARDELAMLDVRHHEPPLALDGGVDGLELVRTLLAAAHKVCNPGALILVEHGADQGAAVLELAAEYVHPTSSEIVKDYAGLDRFLRARL